jgi:hypothetical protein
MTVSPVNLHQALATVTDTYTDEFFLVLDGGFDIALRDAGDR